jgi:hypothetical protein
MASAVVSRILDRRRDLMIAGPEVSPSPIGNATRLKPVGRQRGSRIGAIEHARFVGLDIHQERISIAGAESVRSDS